MLEAFADEHQRSTSQTAPTTIIESRLLLVLVADLATIVVDLTDISRTAIGILFQSNLLLLHLYRVSDEVYSMLEENAETTNDGTATVLL